MRFANQNLIGISKYIEQRAWKSKEQWVNGWEFPGTNEMPKSSNLSITMLYKQDK
jgi:hypothetical protein